ncbi:MAG: M23 family metallopeptidase [Patescibacteria group bacterium]
MNAVAIRYIALAFSMKQELKIIFFTLFIICMLPIIGVVMLTQVGINAVSGVLASNDVQTAQVNIHDPVTGEIVDTILAPAMWPVNGVVTLEYGQSSPYQFLHSGIDIANGTIGDPVGAFMAGTVTYAGETSWGFGKHVKIDHGYHVTSIYAHLDSIAVQVGDKIDIGTIVGTRGDTGWSTGPHLHFQINVFGIPIEPRIFLTGDPPTNPPEQIPNPQT